MKTEPSPEDLRPRTAHDPEDFEAVAYRWDGDNCRTCPFWDAEANQFDVDGRSRCPRVPERPDRLSDWDRLACLTTNRPENEGNVKYFRRRTYGNEEDA
jgi:hypothetical protein